MLAETLRRIARDYPRLPAYLPTDTAERMPTEGRTSTRIHSPVPIRVEVSDLIARIGVFAIDAEGYLRGVLAYGPPYWTKPKPAAVPESLVWSASIVEDPPVVIPDDVSAWIAARASSLDRACLNIVKPGERKPRKARCPRCEGSTLFTSGDRTRCVAAGCGYYQESGQVVA